MGGWVGGKTYRQGIDGDSLFGRDVRPILQVVVLPLLFCFQPQAREPPEVLLTHGFIHLEEKRWMNEQVGG